VRYGRLSAKMNIFDLSYQWRPFESNPGQDYKYPGRVTQHFKNQCTSGIYRWLICRKRPHQDAVYVGESESLHRRLRSYLPSSKDGSSQTGMIRELLKTERTSGSEIKFQWLWFESFNIVNKEYPDETEVVSLPRLSVEYLRRMMENFAR
jgi:hypothetical protein